MKTNPSTGSLPAWLVITALAIMVLLASHSQASASGGLTFTNYTTDSGLGSNNVLGIYADGPSIYAATDSGLSISTNGGVNFTNCTTDNGLGSSFIIGVYADGASIYAATPGGLSISTNGGVNFTNYTSGANGLGSDVIRGVYAAGSSIYAATDSGLSISTNGGANFTNYTTENGLGNNFVYGVYVSGSSIYAATGGGLSISTDGGTNFTNYTTDNGLGSNNVISVYASGSTIYAATNSGLSISNDAGGNFTNYTSGANGLGDDSVNGVYSDGSSIYAATTGGLSISTNGGANFTNYTTDNGLGYHVVTGVYVSGSSIYAATSAGLSISPLPPPPLYWLGSNSTLWTAANNWATDSSGTPTVDFAADADIVFSATGSSNETATDLGGDQTIGSLTINTTSAVGITGGNLTINGTSATAMTVDSTAGNVTITAPLVLAGSATTLDIANQNTTIASISTSNGVVKTGNGSLTLTGSNTYTGGTTVNSGTLAVSSGGSISHAASNMLVGSASGDNGTLAINGGNVTNAQGIIGQDADSTGAVYVSSGNWTSSSLRVGKAGTGSLALSGGVINSVSGYSVLGYDTGSNGAVTVSGGSWTNSFGLGVGLNGNGSLTISGGNVSNTWSVLGLSSSSNGTVIVSGGNWTNSSSLTIANAGTGSLTLSAGNVINTDSALGYDTGSNGTVTVSGGSWTNSSDLTIGYYGQGNLAISGGDVTNASGTVGFYSGSNGAVSVCGGNWTNNGSLTVGFEGTGSLAISGGNVSIGGGVGTLTIASSSDSNGTLNIGNGTTAGNLQAASVSGGSGTAVVNFNHAGNYFFSPELTGSLAVNKLGTGTTTLSGNNTYTGGTQLDGGALEALHANALGNGALTLSSGTLAVGNSANPNLALTGITELVWSSSNAAISLANGGNITITGNFSNGGNTDNRTFDFGAGQSLQLGNNTLMSFGATNFSASNFVAAVSGSNSLSGIFQILGNSLVFNLQGGNASGNVIDNSGADATPTWVVFTVDGNAGNGTVITAGGNNTIRDLTFTNNGNLAIQAGYSLTLSQGQLAVANGSSVVSGGTLATPGNFNKTGSGELDVQSALSVNGAASIDAGLLSVNGDLIANSVAVNSSAMLGGNGTIFAPVTVSGTLAPGNSPGTLSMASLTLTPTAVTDIEIESLTNFDRLVVGGAATVDGTLNVIPYNGNPLAYGQQYAFLAAAGGISGEFDTITAPATFRGRFLNLGTTGVLLIAPDSYTRVAVTPNQREVANALDSFIPATSGDRETVSIALDLQTAEQYPYAFEQIAPGFYESLANMAIEQTYNQAQLLTQRMGSLRLGATGFQAIGLSQPIKYDKDGTSTAEAKTASPIVGGEAPTNWNSWVLANGEFAMSRGLAGVPNYNNEAGGFLVGADYRMSENFSAGLFTGYEFNYAKYNGGSISRGNSALFGAYGSYTNENGYYADGVVSGGYTGYQTRRSIQFSTIDRNASADPNSGQFSAALNLGKDFEIGKFTLGPIVGAQYTYAGVGGFTETGAESLNLALGQQNANSLRTNLGARLAYNWEVGSNITLIPEVRGFWMHEFLNNPRNISSALDGGSGASFDYETSAPYRNSIFGGVGVSARFGDRWNASVFYNVNFGSENYTNNIISTSLGFSF